MKSATSINSHFTVAELKIVLNLYTPTSVRGLKANFVNAVAEKYGDSSKETSTQRRTVPSLRTIILKKLNRMPKLATNVLFATNTFLSTFNEWDETNMFSGEAIIHTDTGHMFRFSQWYAQPVKIFGNPIEYIIDPHHIFVNNHSRCCTFGMPGMGIRRDKRLQKLITKLG